MINKIITQYLSANKRLVVPEFGAFIRKDSGEVIFMEFLKKDDGVLTSLLSRELGINEEQARTTIAKFIADIKHKTTLLDSSYIIDGLGAIKASADGVYYLDFDPQAVSAPSHKPTSPSSSQHVQAPEEQQKRAPQPPRSEPQSTTQEHRVAVERETPKEDHHLQQAEAQRQAPHPRPQAEAPQKPKPSVVSPQDNRSTEPPRSSNERRQEGREPQKAGGNRGARPPQSQHKSPQSSGGGKKRIDTVMVVAIIAALIAIVSIVFGIFVNVNPADSMRSTNPVEQREMVDGQNGDVADSLAVDTIKNN